MLLSIIIVNYNVKYFLEQCLYALEQACLGLEAEVIVVDNASTDGSRDWLQPKFPSVQFTWLTQNLGFGKASNLALQQAKGQYILFLNPDTIIAEDSLRLCLDEMMANPNIGALGVRMIDGSGSFLKESKRGLPTGAAALYKFTGLGSIFPRSKKIAAYYAGHLPEKENADVEILSGAYMMLSKKAVNITKGFDEDFFMYGEDVDLSYRIIKAGMRCRYFADTTIIHFKGESTQKFSRQYRKNFYGAMNLFVKKHFPGKPWLKTGTRMLTAIATAWGPGSPASKQEDIGKPLRTAVIASQPVFDAAVQLLKHALPPLTILGRIAAEKDNANKSLGFVEDLSTIIKKQKIEQLIFCSAALPVKKIISLAEISGKKAGLLFWIQGSASMVGSNHKNRKGKFIVAAAPEAVVPSC